MTAGLDITRSLANILAGEPPTPSRNRFQPIRLGLLGIWQYDEQQFYFHDGRLILRGRNGSGKTKVLEVTSPYLLDANLATRRLDPFGTSARSMRDNLLYDGRTHQIGYVWCEYGRIADDGTPEYRTLGAGLRAQASKSGAPDPWYFFTQRRIDIDVRLYNEARNPLNERDLEEVLEPGAVFETADAYQEAVAEDLFGLTTDRFRALVELLIKLRRPKLSENFGVETLTALLSDGLPPIDGDLVDEFARGFDELARDQGDLNTLTTAGRAVGEFLDHYRAYGRCLARHTAVEVEAAFKRLEEARRQERALTSRLHTAESDVERLDGRIGGLDGAIAPEVARVKGLEKRPEIERHELVERLRQEATAAELESSRAKQRLEDAAAELGAARDELEEAERNLSAAAEAAQTASEHATDQANRCGLQDEHKGQMQRIHDDPSNARRSLDAVVEARQFAIQRIRELRRRVDVAQAEFDRFQGIREDIAARRDRVDEDIQRAEADVATQVDAVSALLTTWADACEECRFDDVEVTALLAAIQTVEDLEGPSLASLIDRKLGTVETELVELRAALSARHDQTLAERLKLVNDRDRLAARHHPFPPATQVTRRDRETDAPPGAPLWRLLDFRSGVSPEVRANVEAALLGAGLLDAWVTPDGSLLAADTMDAVILPGSPSVDGDTLASVVTPVNPDIVSATVVQQVIKGITFLRKADPERVGVWISGDGGWALGPVRGRTAAVVARHIGVEAREEARRQALAEIDQRLADFDESIREFNRQGEALQTRFGRLEFERSTRPDDQLIRSAQARVEALIPIAIELSSEVERADERLAPYRTELADATDDLRDYARQHAINSDEDHLVVLAAALSEYRDAVRELVSSIRAVSAFQPSRQTASSRASRQQLRHQELNKEFLAISRRSAELSSESETRHRLLDTDVKDALDELAAARDGLKELADEREETVRQRQRAGEELGEARMALKAIEGERETREGEYSEAVAAFERLRQFGFLSLAGVVAGCEPAAGASLDAADAQRVAETLRDEDASDSARDRARNAVDEQFREMQRAIDGPDWRPWGNNHGDLFVVSVSHNGQDYDVIQIQTIIADEIVTRQSYLDVQERRLFKEVLLGRVGEHLRQRRVDADDLIKRMNMLLAERPTASGMRMRLIWEADPDTEDGPAVRRAFELLGEQSARYLADDSREELIDFLSGRVKRVREDDKIGDWKLHLREALDYRRWSRIRLQTKDGGGARWTDLNDAKHQKGSGGEKAVMLQLPLFVAAAAHYEGAAARAPRLVYLDEAFAGIDAEMRGSCMALLCRLDLDFVMASHDEWGFYTDVPGLVTYSLFRDPLISGVLTEPFVWDGTTPRRLADPALREDPKGPMHLFAEDEDDVGD